MLILRITPVIVGIFTIGKTIYDMMYSTKAKLRDEYKFAKDFLDEQNLKKIHPFAKDKGYQAIAGCTDITPKEIEYLLSLSNPVCRLDDYKSSHRLFDKVGEGEEFRLVYKKRFRSKVYRTTIFCWYLILYFVLAFISTAPFLFPEWFGHNGMIMLFVTIPSIAPLAIYAVVAAANIKSAERLMTGVGYHTSNILLDSRV